MEVVKIKIGNREYDIKDAFVRDWIYGDGEDDFIQLVKNIIKYGIADISDKTEEELEQLEEEQRNWLFEELDPIFAEHIAAKLIASVDNAGVLNLVGE